MKNVESISKSYQMKNFIDDFYNKITSLYESKIRDSCWEKNIKAPIKVTHILRSNDQSKKKNLEISLIR